MTNHKKETEEIPPVKTCPMYCNANACREGVPDIRRLLFNTRLKGGCPSFVIPFALPRDISSATPYLPV